MIVPLSDVTGKLRSRATRERDHHINNSDIGLLNADPTGQVWLPRLADSNHMIRQHVVAESPHFVPSGNCRISPKQASENACGLLQQVASCNARSPGAVINVKDIRVEHLASQMVCSQDVVDQA